MFYPASPPPAKGIELSRGGDLLLWAILGAFSDRTAVPLPGEVETIADSGIAEGWYSSGGLCRSW
jgi:hypothetical protein